MNKNILSFLGILISGIIVALFIDQYNAQNHFHNFRSHAILLFYGTMIAGLVISVAGILFYRIQNDKERTKGAETIAASEKENEPNDNVEKE